MLTGPFILLEFPEHRLEWMKEEPVVYAEQFTGDLYLGDEKTVGRYRDAYTTMCRMALTEEETRALLLETAEDYES